MIAPRNHSLNTAMPVNTADPVNRSHTLNNARLAWWLSLPGIDGGRQLHDLMGLYHATLTSMGNTNNGWRWTNPRPSALGPSILCDGSAGYMAVGNPAALRLQKPFTIAGWFRTPRNQADMAIMMHTTAYNSSASQYGLAVQSNGAIDCERASGGQLISSSGVVSANTWTRGLAVYGTSATTIYVNGLQVVTGAAVGTLSYSGSLQLGAYVAGGGRFPGNLDDITIWGRELSASEIMEDYRLSQAGYPGVLNRPDFSAYAELSTWFWWGRSRGSQLLRSL